VSAAPDCAFGYVTSARHPAADHGWGRFRVPSGFARRCRQPTNRRPIAASNGHPALHGWTLGDAGVPGKSYMRGAVVSVSIRLSAAFGRRRSIGDYIAACRMERAKHLLASGMSVKWIA
jgi:hypothetical protein